MKKQKHWFYQLSSRFSSCTSHMFILWGNIYDLQKSPVDNTKYMSLDNYLVHIMKSRKLVMFYTLSAGLEFANGEMEVFFRDRYIAKSPPVASEQGATQSARDGLKKAKSDKASLNEHVGNTPDQAFKFLEKTLLDKFDDIEGKRGSVLVINYAHNICSPSSQSREERITTEMLERWANDDRITEARNLIILVTPSLHKLPDCIHSTQSGVSAIRIPKPGESDRVDRWRLNKSPLASSLTYEILGRITNGLSFKQIDSICNSRSGHSPITMEMVKERKKEILEAEFGDRIKISEPKFGFDKFGGKDYLKEYGRKIINNIVKGVNRRVPMGILAAGPPGTGKTFFFECLAYECGFNFVEIVNPRSMWVGQSEEMAEKIFAALDDMAPVIVVEDEADQSEPSRDDFTGDSGVSNRLRQMKFKFTSDPGRRGRVIWVRISNRPDKIDAAYKREGRSDDTIPFLMPEATEYPDIFRVMFERYEIPHRIQDFSDLGRLAAEKGYCSGASVEWMVLEADKYAENSDSAFVTYEHVRQAIDDWESKNDPAEIDRQIILAINGSSKRLRPNNWREVYNLATANIGCQKTT